MKELNPILTEDNLSTKNEIIETKNSIDDNQFKNTSKNLKRLKPLIKGVKNSVKLVRRISNARLLNYVNILESVNRKGKIRKEEKFNLNQKGIIELAQQHSLSNRPLKVLKDPTELNDDTRAIKYCVCCNLPSITPNIFDTFKMCDNTDLYSVLGEAISLYFSYFKFCIFILFVALCILIVPSFYMINKYHSSLEKMCENIRDKKFKVCESFYHDKNLLKNNTKSNSISFQDQLNAMNILLYKELYDNLMELNSNDTSKKYVKYDQIIDKISINNSISYFIVLLTLFLINILYIIFQNNTILYYNYREISPSDYAIMMSNMSGVYKYFHQMKKNYKKNKNLYPEEFRKKLGYKDTELYDNNITEAMEFISFIKKFVINKNEKYNVETINICYKLEEYTKLKEEADKYNDYLFELENNQLQIKKNRQLNLHGNRRVYFKTLIPDFIGNTFDFCGCKNNFCGKKIKIIDILKRRRNKEKELNLLLEDSNNIRNRNFANVAFISFSTVSEQETFLKKYKKNFFQKIIFFFKNFKYFFCKCFLSKESEILDISEIDKFLDISAAPEPDDIIFENLETREIKRFFLICFNSFISFLIIAICFIIVILLTMAQEKINNLSFGEKNFSKYAVSFAMTGIISIVDIILEIVLGILTKNEKHISLTNFNLSFSVKLTICTFVNSAIVPLISSICANLEILEINYDLLVSNMLMMFAVNSVVSPLMWTFNVEFYLKKLMIWKIKEKKNQDMNQKKLNELFEYIDINLAYKYSYLAKTLLMTFFYLPLFPLGIAFSMFGFIFGFYLEKFNMGHRYKRPEMMNKTICKFYTNFFVLNFFMLALGDYIFLKDKYKTNYWQYVNIIIFFLALIIPFGLYLQFNFLGKNQSNINNKTYSQVYISFYNDYELINPITIKKGRIKYLECLKNLNYLSEKELLLKKNRLEKTSFYKIISEAKPTKINRSLGVRKGLLQNININESNAKPKRLFELIKKLYQSYIDDEKKIKKEKEKPIFRRSFNINSNIEINHRSKIPNILQLAGTIFRMDENEESNFLDSLKETESRVSSINPVVEQRPRKSKTYMGNNEFFKNQLNKNKIPFIIKATNKIKNININNEQNEMIQNLENNNEQNNINSNLNTSRNEINSENHNTILGAIETKIKEGKKNLMHYSDWCKEKEIPIKENSNDGEKINRRFNRLKTINIEHTNTNNSNNSGNINYISNISVTINQYFDKNKDNKDNNHNNIFDFNSTIMENEQEENEENSRHINIRKNVLIEEGKENTEINNRPINNIINIVLNNDNKDNINININNNENNNKVILNEYNNIK